MPRRERSCRKGFSRDDFENVFVSIDALRLHLRHGALAQAVEAIQREPPPHGVPDKFARAHVLLFCRARQIASQIRRQADGQGRSHVRQIKTVMRIRQPPPMWLWRKSISPARTSAATSRRRRCSEIRALLHQF